MAFTVTTPLFHAALLCSGWSYSHPNVPAIHAYPHPDGGVLIASTNGHVMFIGRDPSGKIDTLHHPAVISEKKNRLIKLAENDDFSSVAFADYAAGFYATRIGHMNLKSDQEIITSSTAIVKAEKARIDQLYVYMPVKKLVKESDQQFINISAKYLRLICDVADALRGKSDREITITNACDKRMEAAPHVVSFNTMTGGSFDACMLVMGRHETGGMTNAQALEFVSKISGFKPEYHQ